MESQLEIEGDKFVLHPSGAMYWAAQDMLLIADVHLGKVTHFRKHGAAIPPHLAFENLEKLTEVTNHYQPKTVCFLGDLFHSNLNSEWHDFAHWVSYSKASVVLVNGNHDIIPAYLFEELGVLQHNSLKINSFLLTHHPTTDKKLFNFCGHIHPGVRLQGIGKQTITLPCFYKTKQQLILPAFGNFTGKHILTPYANEDIYVIVEGEVIYVSS